MSTVGHVPIAIQGDFLARQTRALPIAAFLELSPDAPRTDRRMGELFGRMAAG